MAKHKPVKFAVKTGGDYDLMASMLNEAPAFKRNSIVKGTVSEIKGNEIIFDIGYKSPGILSASEFKDTEVTKGAEFDVFITNLEGADGEVLERLQVRKYEDLDRTQAVNTSYRV